VHPLLFGIWPSYFTLWVVAATSALILGAILAKRADTNAPTGRTLLALALCVVAVLGGSKVLYVLETYWFPHDDYVPAEMRSARHGFRIPGGMLALAALLPVFCRGLKLPWRRFGDSVAILAALALIFIRLGCFLNGCCFGKPSDAPWAMSFPKGSWAFWYHQTQHWVPTGASHSLPVEPLQLHFCIAAASTLAFLLLIRRRSLRPGLLQLIFYTLFFGTTALLEPLRQVHLTLNSWIVPLAAIACASLLLTDERRQAVHVHNVLPTSQGGIRC